MKIFDCTCDECQAEFQAVLEDEKDTVKCPACESEKVKMTESELQAGCGSGCGNCSGSCSS
jgi:Zn finger protein HypA/HybF involved in hydrogenase expression